MSTLTIAVVCAITGSGVVTGLLFAFSNFVMRALDDLPPEHALVAMQRINERIINPIFVVAFFGTPLLCLGIVVLSAMGPAVAGRSLLIAGSVGYLLGPLGVTMLFNVPLNNRLADTDASDASAAWPAYRTPWQRWNHLRTYIGIVSIALLSIGLAGGLGT